ncbi:hypothetical protein [Kitasatospora cineracea]|uniref:hypothetical protein n=1 Tax=Kitasatospora cineracea TaxID=88074 RepID=UPI0033C6EEE0
MTTDDTFTLGQLIAGTLHLRGIQAKYNAHGSANASWLEVHLPGGTAIWISDQDARIDIDPRKHQGLHATHHLGDPYGEPGHAITVHDADRDPATASADTVQADIDALADATATYIDTWNKTPAARHQGRRIDEHGVMDLPARHLRPGDITIYTATGAEAVVVKVQHLGPGGQYRRTVRTITPPTRGGAANLPASHWRFPFNFRSTGSQAITVLAHRHRDPATLPRIRYPKAPDSFNDGDHIVHDSIIWERTNSTWSNGTRDAPISDTQIRLLFTDDNRLRLGTPAYQPAH